MIICPSNDSPNRSSTDSWLDICIDSNTFQRQYLSSDIESLVVCLLTETIVCYSCLVVLLLAVVPPPPKPPLNVDSQFLPPVPQPPPLPACANAVSLILNAVNSPVVVVAANAIAKKATIWRLFIFIVIVINTKKCISSFYKLQITNLPIFFYSFPYIHKIEIRSMLLQLEVSQIATTR